MFAYLFSIFSDCVKVRNEPHYIEIIEKQERSYDHCSIYSSDPLWQDRRMLSFYHCVKK